MLDKPNDLADALRRCANRDKDGLRAIFESEAPRLLSVAKRILRRRDLAEEVVQEAFIQIWAKAHQYEPERGSARGWVYAIVRNRALNMLRDSNRMELTADGDITSLQESEDAESALSAWSRLASNSRLRRCLAGLDDPKRKSILMAYVTGYSHGEIAGRLNVPLGTAKAWIRRGLAALRECMA